MVSSQLRNFKQLHKNSLSSNRLSGRTFLTHATRTMMSILTSMSSSWPQSIIVWWIMKSSLMHSSCLMRTTMVTFLAKSSNKHFRLKSWLTLPMLTWMAISTKRKSKRKAKKLINKSSRQSLPTSSKSQDLLKRTSRGWISSNKLTSTVTGSLTSRSSVPQSRTLSEHRSN